MLHCFESSWSYIYLNDTVTHQLDMLCKLTKGISDWFSAEAKQLNMLLVFEESLHRFAFGITKFTTLPRSLLLFLSFTF